MAKDSVSKEKDKSKKKKGPNKVLKYLRDLKSEIKKVVWPTRKQLFNNTAVVLAVMVVTALFLAGVDYGVSFLVKILLGIDIS